MTAPRPRRNASRRTAVVVLAFCAATFAGSGGAFAANPLNSSETAAPEGVPAAPRKGENDFTLVPAAGGSSDIGGGGGFFAGLTRNRPGWEPFVWHLEAAGFVSVNERNGHAFLPFSDIYTRLTVNRFLGAPFQLEVRPSFTDEQALYYYGMGNQSSAVHSAGSSKGYFEYARMHPELLADLRFRLVDHVSGKVGIRYIESWYDIPAGTKLGDDIRAGSPEVRKLIGPTGQQGDAMFRYGLQFDDRDNTVSPQRGMLHEVAVNFSPGGTSTLPFRYGEASANLRAYVPLFSPRLTLAMRVVGDVFFGDAPLYELSRAVDNYAIGGSNGVRGVPSQRYYGKVKLFGNAELRATLFDTRLFGKPVTIGSAAFFDGGRVWADTSPRPEASTATRLD